jgi:hypothetical protein
VGRPLRAGDTGGGRTPVGWRPVLLGAVEVAQTRQRSPSEARGGGLDAERPARDGLGTYYDAQLLLLRSEYEYLRLRGADKPASLFEESFGFTAEDPFETGPLNVAPDTEGMQLLRERWERRIAMRRERGMDPPALGLREDLAYRVFPREMTVPVELATRRAYLTISRELLLKRYGRNPREKEDYMPEALRRRVERDLSEYAALTRRPARRS